MPSSITTSRLEARSPTGALRPRRPRRVLYPAFQTRRPAPKEAPDRALHLLLLLSALLFLQIYTEDARCCTELQSQSADPAASPPQQADGNVDAGPGREGEEPRRLQAVVGSEQQVCVVV